jgi:hypothetical protein
VASMKAATGVSRWRFGVLRHIRKLASCRTDEELPDGQLLERFATLRLVVAAGSLPGVTCRLRRASAPILWVLQERKGIRS